MLTQLASRQRHNTPVGTPCWRNCGADNAKTHPRAQRAGGCSPPGSALDKCPGRLMQKASAKRLPFAKAQSARCQAKQRALTASRTIIAARSNTIDRFALVQLDEGLIGVVLTSPAAAPRIQGAQKPRTQRHIQRCRCRKRLTSRGIVWKPGHYVCTNLSIGGKSGGARCECPSLWT